MRFSPCGGCERVNMLQMFEVMKSHNNITNYNILLIDVQYRQSESDGESHRTSFTMDPMEFFFRTGHVTNIHMYFIT